MALLTQSLRMREAAETTYQPSIPGNLTISTNKKRGREMSYPGTQEQPLKRGPGKPSFIEIASRDRSQSRLRLRANRAMTVNSENDEEQDTDMDEPTPTSNE
jgi:hypothetical protein